MQPETTTSSHNRVVAIDLLRGIVMIIMALDHVRDFYHAPAFLYDPLDLSQTSVPIFLTRWITHFCAAVFVFLAGTSSYLTLERKGRKRLSTFLFTRGIWLIVVELTLVNFALFFHQVTSFMLLQVIWAIGVSMIALSALIYLPLRWLLVVALVIVFGHNILDAISFEPVGAKALLWSLLHQSSLFTFGSFKLFVGYPVLPWIGVMCAGYCFGSLYKHYQPIARKRMLIIIGLLCIILFIVLRLINTYGDPAPWSAQKNGIFTLLSFINTTKYPPSLLFLLMILGPAILLLAFIEQPLNRFTSRIAVYGRVPMFYYILHFYIIHISYVIVAVIMGHSLTAALNSGIFSPIPGFGFGLLTVYFIWLAIVAFLYPLCKRYDQYKRLNKDKWWLSYL